jgi:hypothetical protein
MKDYTHRDGKSFRRRFRVPFSVWEVVSRNAAVLVINHFTTSYFYVWSYVFLDTDVSRRASKPIFLKLLSVLRVLGRGEVFDSCSECTNISISALQTFFHKWIQKFRGGTFRSQHSSPPGDEIGVVMSEYERVGVQGQLVVPIARILRWDMCPAKYHSWFKVKEPYASIAYEYE